MYGNVWKCEKGRKDFTLWLEIAWKIVVSLCCIISIRGLNITIFPLGQMLCPWTTEHRDDQCVVSNSGQYLLPVDKCRNREYFESCLFNVPAFSNMQ